MEKIKLPNRNKADLWLRNIEKDIWKLEIDSDHSYCLRYMRMGGFYDITEDNTVKWKEIKMIDPAGGPFLEVGDPVNEKYKIVEFLDNLTMRLGERNSNI